MLREVLIICAAATITSSAIPNSHCYTFASRQDVVAGTTNRERGIALYKARRYRDANVLLKKAIRERKTDYEAWHYLGLTQIQLNDFKKATKSFESALASKPDYAAAHVGLSYSLLRRNKSIEAVSASEKALQINPNIAEAHYIIGVANLRNDDRVEAVKHADLAISVNPKFAGAYLLKGQALVSFVEDVPVTGPTEAAEKRRSRYQQAKEALEEYLRLDPNPPFKETWEEQLAVLTFHAMPPEKQDESLRPRTGREVTTKARVLSKPEPRYTEAARSNGITGTVVLRAVFAADGTVKHILVVRGLPDGLTEACIKAARKIRFTPAMIGEQPVSMFMQLEYNFNLF
jgi:TonB family protein